MNIKHCTIIIIANVEKNYSACKWILGQIYVVHVHVHVGQNDFNLVSQQVKEVFKLVEQSRPRLLCLISTLHGIEICSILVTFRR